MTDLGMFKKNDLVWAKMKGFSPWPGMIVTDIPKEMPKAPKKNCICVYFFGTKNHGWVEEPNIKHYLPYKEELIKTCKTATFRDAVNAIEEHRKNPQNIEADYEVRNIDEEFNKLREKSESIDETPKKAKKEEKTPKSILVNKTKSEKRASSMHSSRRKRNTSLPLENHKRFKSEYQLSTPGTSRRNDLSTLLNRPAIGRPKINELNMSIVSGTLKEKKISPSHLTFGFLGLGIMGGAIAKNFIDSGHKVVVWNRTSSKCRKFEEVGASVCNTPSDVVEEADIIFSCVADPQAAKDMVFGNCGVLRANSITSGKGYVELSTIDPETSQDIAEAITTKGGRYLEAQLQGSKSEAEEGTLVILAAGDHSLFNECQTCFEAIGKNSFFLGEVGNGCKINLVIQAMIGVSLVGMSEGMALADRFGISIKDVLEIVELTAFSSGLVLKKGKEMHKGEFSPEQPLSHMQKDLKLTLNMADPLDHPMPATAVANEVFKHAKRLGYYEHDASAVYVRARF